VYVADTGNGRVLAIPTSGGGIKTVVAGLKDPVALAVGVPVAHTADTLYVADRAANRVYAIRGTRKLVVAGTGTAGFSGDGGPAADAELSAPSALFVDPLGNLYIADAGSHRVRMVDPGGIITTVAGTGAAGSSRDGTPATDAELMSPDGLTGDGAGNLYIADAGANRVYRVDPVGKLTTFAGTGEAGYTAAGPATDAKFSAPAALAFAGVSYTLGSDPVAPFALYVLDTGNDVVRVINAYGIVQPELAGVAGNAGATGDGGPAAAALLNAPAGLWASPSGDRVYIADAGNNRVRALRGPGA
jgi:sugar lactone lactonase YvrE